MPRPTSAARRPEIVVPDDYPPVFTGSAAEARLRSLGDVTVHTARGADDERELARRIGSADAVVNIRAHARFTGRVINACPNLRLISIWGTGTDHVDLAACRSRGIAVASTPGVNAHAVAEHALALILAALRRIPALDADLRAGRWAREPVAQLEARMLGVVGLGAIGRRVAALGAAFGARVLTCTQTADNGRAAALGARAVPLETIFAECDVVTLHLRLDESTRGLVGHGLIDRMPPTAWLVNTARGALVDRAALLAALTTRRIGGAALDVFHDEPLPADDPLRALPNVVLTPHIAGTTPQVIARGLDAAVQNVEAFLRNLGVQARAVTAESPLRSV
jgi:D-3-phosphoglycerate dehydrogenase